MKRPSFLNQSPDHNVIIQGERGAEFKNFIMGLLKQGNLKPHYIEALTDENAMKKFDIAFTAPSANPNRNYDVYEQLGDLSINKFLVTYAYKRFSQINCPEGVEIASNVRITYGAKNKLYPVTEELGFWKFITASKYDKSKNKKPLLEDCFESFIGCAESIIDERFKCYIGYSIVFSILQNIYNCIGMSIKYEDITDPITRLKELFDKNQDILGKSPEYKDHRDGDFSYVTIRAPKYPNPIGSGVGPLKESAKKAAARNALQYLASNFGIIKEVPDLYKRMNAV